MLICEYDGVMPRAPTTSDAFNALAEPRRRQIVELLSRRGAMAVGALVASLGLPQPAVSRHLAVLREVGVVSVAREGRHRLYRLEPGELRRVHDWVSRFERLWTEQLGRVKHRAERRAAERLRAPDSPPDHPRGSS
jgi:DNA-binding transcriptional ArsR family regulator